MGWPVRCEHMKIKQRLLAPVRQTEPDFTTPSTFGVLGLRPFNHDYGSGGGGGGGNDEEKGDGNAKTSTSPRARETPPSCDGLVEAVDDNAAAGTSVDAIDRAGQDNGEPTPVAVIALSR